MTWMQMRGNCAIKLFTSYMSSDHLCMNTVNEPPLKMFFFPSTAFFQSSVQECAKLTEQD